METTATQTNETNVQAQSAQSAQALQLHTDTKAATLLAQPGERTIVQNFKNPARKLAVNIPGDAWQPLATVPEQFRGLLDTVLTSAGKSILRRYAGNYSVFPSTIPAALFTVDAIMNEAAGNNSEWLSKEELTQAWETSATRKAYINDPRYAASKEFRSVVNYLADLYLRLAGKTSAYKPDELDLMVAKLREDDHDSELGAFVFMRVEQLRNRKQPEAVMNLDLL